MRTAELVTLAVVLGVAAGGCKKPPGMEVAGDGGAAVDGGLRAGDGGINYAEPGIAKAPQVTFTIEQVFVAQKPSTTAPWHEAGGTWTFFDAKTSDDTRFGFGFNVGKPMGGMAEADVMLTVADRENGVKLVSSLATRFKGRVPAEKPAQPLAPRPFKAVVLGADMKRSASGFDGTGGGYHATKLFLQRPGIEAELYFNFSLAEKSGMFAEKDAEYADDVVEFIASELRDGPRPKRTAATDPNMSDHGPRIRWLRDLPGNAFGMSTDRDRFWMAEPVPGGGVKVVSVGFAKEGDGKELLRVPHLLGALRCGGELCLAEDLQPKDPRFASGDDPRAIILFDTKAGIGKVFKGPWARPALPSVAVSPRGDLFVVSDAVPDLGAKNPFKHVLYLGDRAGVVKGPVDLGPDPWEVTSLDASAKATRVVVRKGSAVEKNATLSHVAIDSATLAITPAVGPARPLELILSPDGKHTVECLAGTLVVRDVATKVEKRFPIHEDDRAAISASCVSWANNRYLMYQANSRGFVDVETMKLSEAFAKDDGANVDSLEFDKTFTYAIGRHEKVARLGRIVVE